LDIDKLQRGEYTLEELLDYSDANVGQYQNTPLFIKKGQFGHYLEWGVEPNVQRKSIPNIAEFMKDTTDKQSVLEKATQWIEHATATAQTQTETEKEQITKDKKILRSFNEYVSVRQGKYGTFVYYKPPHATAPQFFSLKKCSVSYATCSLEEMMSWIGKHKKFKA
jgi:topoisomerase IA-like protein